MPDAFTLKDGRTCRIRPYEPKDRVELREIFGLTAHHGEPYHRFFDAPEWLADFMTAYHTECEPESCFVADVEGRVVGYLTGAADTARFRRVWPRRILPSVVANFFLKRVWKFRRTWAFLWQGFKSGWKGESHYPASDFERFPAHFHINVRPGFQLNGIGRRLAEAFFERLRVLGVPGVHVRTARLELRNPFFESLGFVPLYSRKLTLWTYLGEPSYYLITYGLSLKNTEAL